MFKAMKDDTHYIAIRSVFVIRNTLVSNFLSEPG